MFEYFEYPFFRQAFLAVVLISISAAMIGTYIITRRLVSISGGITHACFGGLGLGYFLGLNPVAMAAVVAVGSSVGVELMEKRMKLRSDSAVAVIWALGMALGVLFVFLTPGYVPELNAFLFGNILTVTSGDLWIFGAFAALLSTFFLAFYHQIVSVAFDADFARVSGLPVRFISYSMTVFVAVCIVLTIRLVGIMLLMSMLSLPMITAEVFYSRFRPIMLASIVISIITGIGGLLLSTVIDVPCSALIVLLMAGVFVIAKIAKSFVRKFGRQF